MRRKRLSLHKYLCSLLTHLPTDYEPWGNVPDSERGPDCGCGCDWFIWLELDADIGVCCNPKSPRFKLLTFEHQAGIGCYQEGIVKLANRTHKEIDYQLRRWTAREKREAKL